AARDLFLRRDDLRDLHDGSGLRPRSGGRQADLLRVQRPVGLTRQTATSLEQNVSQYDVEPTGQQAEDSIDETTPQPYHSQTPPPKRSGGGPPAAAPVEDVEDQASEEAELVESEVESDEIVEAEALVTDEAEAAIEDSDPVEVTDELTDELTDEDADEDDPL